jgi:ATP-dependent Clp protease ATP-binding subunit ClpC
MLADRVYGDEKALITLDMSEFQERYSSSRLVGSPPGYVGYDEGGQLTEKVRRRPYSVVLFDEFEKANGDVCNMLLQILDEGRLTDGQGRVIDFRNTIIICTANLGFDFAREGHSLGFAKETAESSFDVLKEKLLAEAKRAFRPELLNRFDETVVFRKLEKDDLRRILDLELAKLQERLKGSHIQLSLDRKAADFLVEKGTDSALGARPLRRVVQEFVEDPLADLVLAGKSKPRLRGRLAKDGKSIRF